jgi:glycosyltransferase involved in cell wall biosynthesis
MDEKLVSIIIPVYNHARRLKQSLFSISEQTYRNLEIIIVNDGSTDDFEQQFLAIKNSPELSRLKIILINQKNSGAPAARNRGFVESTGEFIIFWDADTVGKPEMLRKMVNALEENKEASYAYSGFLFGVKKFSSKPFDAVELKKVNYIDTTSLIRRSDMLFFDPALKKFQDWDLWLNMLSKNKIGIYIPEILYKKFVGGRKGISEWLPRFAYHLPWKLPAVRRYEQARNIILAKHGLKPQ